MSNIVPLEGISPFDSIRRFRTDGSEYWDARELMKLMGYLKWQNFETAIKDAIENLEINGDKVLSHFLLLAVSYKGQEKSNYELTRYASYMTALCCDGRKPEVAAAKKYFATKTREAETSADTLKVLKESNKNLELQLKLVQANLEALKIEKGIIAPSRASNYKVIDLTGIDNIESVEAYIRDRIKLNPNGKVYVGKATGNASTLLYPNYLEYCNQHDHDFVTVQRFSRVLMQLVYATMQARLWKGKDAKGCHVKGVEIAA